MSYREVIPLPAIIPELGEDAYVLDDDVSGVHEIHLEEPELVETRESWKPGELQQENHVPAFNIAGFKGMEVTATLRKYKARFDKPENPNQDNIIIDAKQNLIAVADELGGEEKKGASKRLEEVLPGILRQQTLGAIGLESGDLLKELTERQQSKFAGSDEFKNEIRNRMKTLVERLPEVAEKALGLLRALEQANEEIKKTGALTTFCGGIVHTQPNGERWAIVANIGDSTAYKQRPDGTLIPLFDEDSLLLVAVKTGAISTEQLEKMQRAPQEKFEVKVTKDIALAMGATDAQADEFVARGTMIPISYRKLKSTMFAALGGTKPVASLAIRRFDPKDRLLLWTDGVEDMFPNKAEEGTDEERLAKALAGKTEAERLDNLTQAAVTNGKEGVASNKDGDDIGIVSAFFE